MTMRSRMSFGALVVMFALLAGCASFKGTEPAVTDRVQPGQVFAFEGQDYRFDVNQEDFVLLRRVEAEGNPGEITGWVKEVFRVSRYHLGDGRWYMYEGLPGAYLQWKGGDEFTVVRDQAALGGAEVAVLR